MEQGRVFAQCLDGNGQPIIQPLDTVDALLRWSPGKDEACVSVTPLRGAPKGASGPRTLICHDLSGGYLEDRFVQGVCPAGQVCYTFYHWHLVDTFIYFSHHFVTIPPPAWVSAAHKHRVKVLGTFITEWEEGGEKMKAVLRSDQSMLQVVDQMTAIAEYYHFDGWLINIENKIQASDLDMLVRFVRTLTERTRTTLPHGEVIWYDSVTQAGLLEWQNALNDLNSQYFDVCDGIFLNYTWTEENLAQSKAYAVERGRPWDVWVGVDVFGRGCKGGGGYNTAEAVSSARAHDLSLALFAQAWTYECLPKEDFISNENRFWEKLERHCITKPITDLPLSSTFCRGYGHMYFLNGQKRSTDAWFNLGQQSLQGMGTYERSKEDNSGVLDAVVVSLCTEDAYRGGGCLRLDRRVTKATSDNCYNLFQMDVRCSEPTLVSFSWKPVEVNSTVFLEISLRSENVQHTVRLVPQEKPEAVESGVLTCKPLGREDVESTLPVLGTCQADSGGWITSYFRLEKPETETSLEGVSVGLQGSLSGPGAALLGSLQILPWSSLDQPLPVVSGLRLHSCSQNSCTDSQTDRQIRPRSKTTVWLSWTVNQPLLVDHYNIFGSDNSCPSTDDTPTGDDWTLVGHSNSCCFCVRSPAEVGSGLRHQPVRALRVQPVLLSGLVPALSSCPVIHLTDPSSQ